MEYAELRALLDAHLPLESGGKVRDTYRLPGNGQGSDGLLLPVCSDRASVFDFKLGFPVPGKGAELNAFNVAARLFLEKTLPPGESFFDDMHAFGADIDECLPEALCGIPELQRRAIVVDELEMEDVEFVVRGHLTGSGYKAYAAGKSVCGHLLPAGIREGEELPTPILTPTTKAKVGHDEPLDIQNVRDRYGMGLERRILGTFKALAAHSRKRGIIAPDTKFELGCMEHLPSNRAVRGGLILADEVWTPDSSRFWDAAEYEACFPDALPQPMDKQLLRDWAKEHGVDTLDPKDPDHVAFVASLPAPEEVVRLTQERIATAFAMLWERDIAAFQCEVLRVRG